MIGYTTLGTADLGRARAFYDAVLAQLGAQSLLANEREAYWGHGPTAVKFAVVVPFDGAPPSVGNGTMIALRAEDREQVDATHRAAIEHGGTDSGARAHAARVRSMAATFETWTGTRSACSRRRRGAMRGAARVRQHAGVPKSD